MQRLAERLKAAGVRVWYDEWSIKPGDNIYLLLDAHCRKVTALDPDHTRLSAAKSRLDLDQQVRVAFVGQTIQDFVPQAGFDMEETWPLLSCLFRAKTSDHQ